MGRAPRWCVYGVCFALTALFRFLRLESGFANDHFVYITGGWQWLHGDWPTRDWVDGGAPLMVGLSALSQRILGQTLLPEGLVVALAFGLAAALTAAVVFDWTQSLTLASVAAFLEVAVLPRTYSYPKALVYALALLCFVRYARSPSLPRVVAIAASVVLAFLFRHDHGVIVGLGAALTTLLTGERVATGIRRTVFLATVVCVALGPYLVYVQVYEGLLTHAGIGAGYGGRELVSQWGVWPMPFGGARPFASTLFYWYFLIPIGAAMLTRRVDKTHRAIVVPAVAVALVSSLLFLRDPLSVRLPDPIVPSVVLGAWLVRQGLATRAALVTRVATLAALGLFVASVLEAGDTVEAASRSGLVGGWNSVPLGPRMAELQQRFPRAWPSRASAALVPFYGYVDRCTNESDRLLIVGFLPEVPFFARRRFAGGQRYFGGSYGFDAAAEQRAASRLDQQVVPLALVPTAYDPSAAFPLLSERLRSRYALIAEVPISADEGVRVLVDTTMASRGRDESTGWPCFR